MIFGEASATNLETTKHILDLYSSCNYFKSSIYFTNNISNSVRNEFIGILGVQLIMRNISEPPYLLLEGQSHATSTSLRRCMGS